MLVNYIHLPVSHLSQSALPFRECLTRVSSMHMYYATSFGSNNLHSFNVACV